MLPLFLLFSALSAAVAGAQDAAFERSLGTIDHAVPRPSAEAPRAVLRVPIERLRAERPRSFVRGTLGGEPAGVSLAFGGEPESQDWGVFEAGGKRRAFDFDRLREGVEEGGFLFRFVYENAAILRATRLSDGASFQATYVDLLETLHREGFKVTVGGLEFALFAEEDPIPASISLVQDRSTDERWAYRVYVRSALAARGRVTWFFSSGGSQYGVRDEGDQVVFYSRPEPAR